MADERRLFGTDGIRGEANLDPMTPETALRVGLLKSTIVRLSGVMVSAAATKSTLPATSDGNN